MRPPTSKTGNKTSLRVAFSKSSHQVLSTHTHTPLPGVGRVWGRGGRWGSYILESLEIPVRGHLWASEEGPGSEESFQSIPHISSVYLPESPFVK